MLFRILSILLFFFTLCIYQNEAIACFAKKEKYFVHQDKLIERTGTIVLAKLEKSKPVKKENKPHTDVRYFFKKIRDLKGRAPNNFYIDGIKNQAKKINTFNDHDNVFWKNNIGRISAGTDCELHPEFYPDGTYLIFLEKPYHIRSFEQIESNQDNWLRYVENQTKVVNKAFLNLILDNYDEVLIKNNDCYFKTLTSNASNFDYKAYKSRVLHKNKYNQKLYQRIKHMTVNYKNTKDKNSALKKMFSCADGLNEKTFYNTGDYPVSAKVTPMLIIDDPNKVIFMQISCEDNNESWKILREAAIKNYKSTTSKIITSECGSINSQWVQ